MPRDAVRMEDKYIVLAWTTQDLKEIFQSTNKRLPTEQELMKMLDDIEWYGHGDSMVSTVNDMINEYVLENFEDD
jgi:Tfp pilus assembly protein PilO